MTGDCVEKYRSFRFTDAPLCDARNFLVTSHVISLKAARIITILMLDSVVARGSILENTNPNKRVTFIY